MYRIRKQFKFEMAHQLEKAYSNACSDCIHGHSYILEVFFVSDIVDETGMVIDFGEINHYIKDLVDEWDHALVMSNNFSSRYLITLEEFNKKVKITPYNPTAELIAKDIYHDIYERLTGSILSIREGIIKIEKVRLHETKTGWAEYLPH